MLAKHVVCDIGALLDKFSKIGKKFREKLDKIKKLVNRWSTRGLPLYGTVTIIKFLLIPKFIYASSLMPIPKRQMFCKRTEPDYFQIFMERTRQSN